MAMANKKYVFACDNHTTNITNSFSNLLQNNELVDVTLVADGYLFNAHRLVLSAISPYFRQMFTQMPVTQQAFVFLKDVSKQIIEDLITFIYRGEISVNEKMLEEFLKTAKSLEINGLADQSCPQAYEPKSSASFRTLPAYLFNGFQYQSTRTVPVQSPANEQIDPDLDESSHYGQPAKGFQQQSPPNSASSFGPSRSSSSDQTTCDNNNSSYDNDYFDYDMEKNDTTTEPQAQVNKLNDSDENEQVKPKCGAPKVKRTKRADAGDGFDLIADVRKNAAGRENLYRNGFKYTKHGNGLTRQHWQCTKTKSAYNCRASASTMDIDGVVMVKELMSVHTHPSE